MPPARAPVDETTSNRVYIGVDIGGTNLRAALVDRAGKVLETTRTQIRIDRGAPAAARKLAARCRILDRAARDRGLEVGAIGLGVAGKLDKVTGDVVFSPNLPGMRGYPLGRELRGKAGVPVYVENDANCFGLGESLAGVARGWDNWIGIVLGTGTGGCLFLNGGLWEGDGLGFSAEVGHMIIEPGGPPCPCGSRGCLESFASARALVRGARELIEGGGIRGGPLFELWSAGRLDADSIYECAESGDDAAALLFDKMGWALGIAVANLFSILGIHRAVIGGGVSAAWDRFIGPLRKSLAENLSMIEPAGTVVRRAVLEDAALVGAARFAHDMSLAQPGRP